MNGMEILAASGAIAGNVGELAAAFFERDNGD